MKLSFIRSHFICLATTTRERQQGNDNKGTTTRERQQGNDNKGTTTRECPPAHLVRKKYPISQT